MSLAQWIQPYEDALELDRLATNPNPKLIGYVEENPIMIDWSYLWSNANAMEVLKKNMSTVDWKQICLNPHPDALALIKTHHEYYLKKWEEKRRRIPYDFMLSWENLSQNPSAVEFLKEYPENELWFVQKPPYDPHEDDYDYAGNPYFDNLRPDHQINWNYLSQNSAAMQVLVENPRNINWSWLSSNTAESAIELLQEYPEKIDWYWLSSNPSAMDLIEANLDMVDWIQLSKNPNAVELLSEHSIEIDWPYMCANPNSLWLLEQYRSKLDWRWLCKNPNAGHLLEKNIDAEFEKMDWRWLSANPCIFE
jgi:hypothetical protein